jgi:hypothetical protein
MDSYILCESALHVEVARQRGSEVIIVLTPEAAWSCQQLGQEYHDIHEFCPHGLLNELTETMLRRQYQWAAWLDERLGRAVPEFQAVGFAPVRGHLYFFKRTVDFYSRPSFILKEFVRRARPERVVVFERAPLVLTNLEALPERARLLYAWLAEIVLPETRVEVIPEPGMVAEPARAIASGADTVAPPSALSQLYSAPFDKVLIRARQASWAMRRARARVACVGSLAEHPAITRALRRYRLRVDPTPELAGRLEVHDTSEQRVAKTLAAVWSDIAASKELWSLTDLIANELRGVLDSLLREVVTGEVPRLWAKFLAARRWLEAGSYPAIFGTEPQTTDAGSYLLAAESLGIPRLCMSHNPPNSVADFQIADIVGPIQCDEFLVPGPADVPYFTSFDHRLGVFPRARIVPVGAPRFDTMRRRTARVEGPADDGVFTVLYVPTSFTGYVRFFSEGSSSDVEYFELQQRIFRSLSRQSHVRVLYKPFPSNWVVDPVPDFLAREVPNAEVVKGSVIEMIHVVDAVIIDFPSTALAEAAMTDRPLAVHAGEQWCPLFPRAKALLKKRALVSSTPEEFEANVNRLVTRSAEVKRLADPTFRREHVTYLDDGQSAERIAARIALAAQERLQAIGRVSGPRLPSPEQS